MTVRILNCDVMEGLRQLPDESVHCCVTSPPYWGLRDYGSLGQIGQEATPEAFVATLVAVFQEVRRVLRADGTLWLNLGDSYTSGGRDTYGTWQPDSKQATHTAIKSAKRAAQPPGLKPKDLVGIPWRVAFALQADGWWLRADIIWSKPNPMPESVTDRPTKSHEYVFLFTKSERYHYDAEAIKEPAIYYGLANQDDSGFKDPRSFSGKHQNGYRSQGTSRPTDRAAAFDDRARPPGTAPQSGLGKNEITGDRRKAGLNARWDEAEANGDGPHLRNKRSVWTIATAPFPEAHFATFPPALPELCIKAGCPLDGTVLDPFSGAGTTAMVADRLQRHAIGIELNAEYAAMSERRINGDRGGLLDLMEGAA